ncbi:hypothetical protein VTN00DRAFT_9111 [Thermoascus crustaceus]|uniref:uncharacterized protein n=1 Tax=Thermoascus crustaceus TaxID=5088 RepID=UPI00374338D0
MAPRKRLFLSGAEKRLRELGEETKSISAKFLEKLGQLELKEPHTGWNSFKLELNSTWKQGDIRALEKRLDGIRKQLDTTLLMCLRERLYKPEPSSKTENASAEFKAAKNTEHIAYFAAQFNTGAESVAEQRFRSLILAHLEFHDMRDRHESIPKAHQDTFEWIYQTPRDGSTYPWDDFAAWLRNSDQASLYWITGKAGSGKSTLMKFIYNNPRTYEHL